MKMKTRKLKLVFGLLATQTDEVTIRSTPTGWTVRAVDPSHTSMVDVKIPSTEFVEYEDTEDFAVSLKNINKALANAGEEIGISVGEGRFIIESDGLRSKFPQITVSDTDQKMPVIEYSAKATFSVGEFGRICSAVYGALDSYRFEIAGGSVMISAEDESKNGASLTLTGDKCLNVSGEGRSMFTIEMLDRFVKALPKDAVADVSLGDDMPIEIFINDADIAIRYLLAPRIETE